MEIKEVIHTHLLFTEHMVPGMRAHGSCSTHEVLRNSEFNPQTGKESPPPRSVPQLSECRAHSRCQIPHLKWETSIRNKEAKEEKLHGLGIEDGTFVHQEFTAPATGQTQHSELVTGGVGGRPGSSSPEIRLIVEIRV